MYTSVRYKTTFRIILISRSYMCRHELNKLLLINDENAHQHDHHDWIYCVFWRSIYRCRTLRWLRHHLIYDMWTLALCVVGMKVEIDRSECYNSVLRTIRNVVQLLRFHWLVGHWICWYLIYMNDYCIVINIRS